MRSKFEVFYQNVVAPVLLVLCLAWLISDEFALKHLEERIKAVAVRQTVYAGASF